MVMSPNVVVRTTPWAAGPAGSEGCWALEAGGAGDSDLDPKSFLKKDILDGRGIWYYV